MADSQGATRMNISVPADVKREMDAVTASVNWSAVAVEAFRTKLLELRATQRADKMTEVIARLRAAKELEENTSKRRGHEAGEDWAKQEAKPRELKRLAEAVEVQGSPAGLVHGEHGPLGHKAAIAEVVAGRTDFNTSDCDHFWYAILGDDIPSIWNEDFAEGFVAGALEVWEAVKDHI